MEETEEIQQAKNWKEETVNAVIMAGLAFFQTLIALSVAQLLNRPLKCLVASGVAAGFAFFSTLAIQRGLANNSSGGTTPH